MAIIDPTAAVSWQEAAAICGSNDNDLQTSLDRGKIFHQYKTPGTAYDPTELNFKRFKSGRNYYNISQLLNKLDLSSDMFLPDSNLYPAKNITSNGLTLSQIGGKLQLSNPLSQTEESAILIGRMFTYGTYEIDVDSVTVSGYTASLIPTFGYYPLPASGNQAIVVVRHSGTVGIEAQPDIGVFSNVVPVAPYTLRMQTYGTGMAVFYVKDGVSQLLGEIDFSSSFNWNSSDRKNWNFYLRARLGAGESITVSRVETMLSCGCGQADIRPIKYKNGCPLISQGKLWLTMTCRGFSKGFGQSYAGVFSLNVDTFELKLEGAIFQNINGSLNPVLGIGVVYDGDTGQWLVFCGNMIGSTKDDPRRGIHEIGLSAFHHPYESGTVYNGHMEDPDLIWDETVSKWRMTFGVVYQGGDAGVAHPEGTVLVEAGSWTGPYTEVATPTSYMNQETGTTFQNVGGHKYIFVGRGDNGMNVYSYPGLTLVGSVNMDISCGGWRVWPCIVPIPDSDSTRYILITFDRGAIHGNYSYGALYYYQANEENTGYEFDKQLFTSSL